MISIMQASLLLRRRVVYAEDAFAELVVWHLAVPLSGSSHPYKYRLAYVVSNRCVLRYDNESGKGDHRHCGLIEESYLFSTPKPLIADFQHDLARWTSENRHS
jgi:hypothetical protein